MMSDEYEPIGMLRGTLRIVASAAAAFALVGLVSLASLLLRSERVAENELDLGDANQIAIRSSNSDLKIVEGHGKRLVIRATVTDGLRATNYELHRTGDTIEIVGRCSRWLSPGCGVTATVEVPKGYPLLVASGSASIRAVGLTDRIVTIGSGSGDVIGDRLRVTEFSVQADSSDVSATFSRQPYALKVTTKNGDISARIPRGKIGYQVTIKSDAGKVKSNLVDDKDGHGIVRLLTDSGNITVR